MWANVPLPGSIPIRQNPFAEWPGYWCGRQGIITPDVKRFCAETDLLYLGPGGLKIQRKSGPTRPEAMRPIKGAP